jgi:hypothetical protein
MVHHGYISDLRLSSTKAFMIVALASAAIYGPHAVASLRGSVSNLAPAAGATDTTAQEFGGTLASTRVVPIYREPAKPARTHLVQVRCSRASHETDCYELV